MAAGESAARMDVHGEPLARIEQLDQQGRVGAEALHVLGTEKRLGFAAHDIAQQPTIREPTHALALGAEGGVRGADPILGGVVVARLDPPQGGDRRPTAIEAMQLIGLEQERLHGAVSPDPRTTSSVATTRRCGGCWISVQPRERTLYSQSSQTLGIRADDRDRRGQQIRELEIVEPDQRQPFLAERVDGSQSADGVAVVGGEDRGRTAAGRKLQQLPKR